MVGRFGHISQLLDKNVHDVLLVDFKSLRNETLEQMRSQADLRKENTFVELDKIFTTGWGVISCDLRFNQTKSNNQHFSRFYGKKTQYSWL